MVATGQGIYENGNFHDEMIWIHTDLLYSWGNFGQVYYLFIYLFITFAVLGMEPRTTHVLAKCVTETAPTLWTTD
jgi:hypothetical protein